MIRQILLQKILVVPITVKCRRKNYHAQPASGPQRFVKICNRSAATFESVVLSASSLRDLRKNENHQYDLADQLLFAVGREAKWRPDTNRIDFPALFANTRNRWMVRWASQLIWQVAKECQASPREIEAALFMWGYNVMWRYNVAAEPGH